MHSPRDRALRRCDVGCASGGATSAAPGEFDAFRTAAVFLEGGTLTTSPPERLGTLLPSGKVRYSTRKFGVFTLRVALDRIVVANKGETKLLSLNGVQKKPRELVNEAASHAHHRHSGRTHRVGGRRATPR